MSNIADLLEKMLAGHTSVCDEHMGIQGCPGGVDGPLARCPDCKGLRELHEASHAALKTAPVLEWVMRPSGAATATTKHWHVLAWPSGSGIYWGNIAGMSACIGDGLGGSLEDAKARVEAFLMDHNIMFRRAPT